MFKHLTLIGVLAVISAPAFAAADSSQTISVQPGQGTPLAVQVPMTPEASPYALTGAAPATHAVMIRAGQSDLVSIQVPD